MSLPVSGLHHLKIPVHDLARSREWYEQLLGLNVQLEFRDDDGTVRGVAYEPVGGVRLALREDPDRAAALKGFDPVALAVETRADLDDVVAELDRRGVEHGPVVQATLGWLLAVTSPDELQLRFYTEERHAAAGAAG
jgi:catechol 2,3-dioxygenase-like lactoylglutathione lyase family enzyme